MFSCFLSKILPVKKKLHEEAFTKTPLSKPACFDQSADVNLSSKSLSIVLLSGILKRASAKHNRTVPSLVFNWYSCKRFSIGDFTFDWFLA